MTDDLFLANLQAQQQLLAQLPPLAPQVHAAGQLITRSLQAGGKLMVCGNGGSAADAQHIAL